MMTSCVLSGDSANIEFKIGETWKIAATLHDSTGAVLNLSSAEVKWRLALNSTVLLELSTPPGNGITLVNGGTAGQCLITITPAQQAAIRIESTFYNHECQAILADGTVTDQFAGYLRAFPSLFNLPAPS